MLIVVDEVEPGEDGGEEGRIAGLSGSDALHVRRQFALAVQGLAGLDLGHHLLHVELDLAGVLGHAVESYCNEEVLSLTLASPPGLGRMDHAR